MGCDPERVTAYIDRQLPEAATAGMEHHMMLCPSCAAQAAFELDLGDRLRALALAQPPPGLAGRILAAGGWAAPETFN